MDRLGRKKLDKKQLTPEGDIPKLFTLSGKRYDIKDVMGQFDKDYLIDPNGNIIDVNNK